jgi:hypothetical protein
MLTVMMVAAVKDESSGSLLLVMAESWCAGSVEITLSKRSTLLPESLT